jgi:DNA polymerase-1
MDWMDAPHGDGWALCGNIHDEVQVECRPDWAELIGAGFADCIKKAGEHYALRCPLAGAYAIGDSWQATH